MSLTLDAVAHDGGVDQREEAREAKMDKHGEVKVNVDTVLLTLKEVDVEVVKDGVTEIVKEDRLHVALARREVQHENGKLALVGAIMDGNKDADLEAVVRRSLRDKAGLEGIYFEQLYTFSGKNNKRGKARDTRWPSISVTYIALVPLSKLLASDALSHGLTLVEVDKVPALPFDHNDMIEAAVSRLRGKGAWSVLPAYLLEEEFTLPQLNAVYTRVVGNTSLGQNFRRKVIEAGMLESTGFKPTPGAFRKAEHFRIKPGVNTIDTRL
ncbi:NUDIX hydrolase [Sinorhizobium meliloti]|nr:NUDIX hydrolase [Sinorhizobium meliloti]